MSDRSLVTLALAVLLLAGCNKPSSNPSAAAAPIAENAAVTSDSLAVTTDSTTPADSAPPVTADSIADTTGMN